MAEKNSEQNFEENKLFENRELLKQVFKELLDTTVEVVEATVEKSKDKPTKISYKTIEDAKQNNSNK